MVTLFYGAGKFQYLVNNPHHTTFNEDKGVLHTWAILLSLDAIWDWLQSIKLPFFLYHHSKQ